MPKQYSAEIVCSHGERMLLYVDGLMQRLEVHPEKRQPKVWIQRPDKGVKWSLSPHTGSYSETSLPPVLETEVSEELERVFGEDWTEDGSEMIAGRACRKFVGRSRAAAAGQTVCFVDAETGMRTRECSYDANGELFSTTDYSSGSPPSSLFELPEGYTRG